MAWATPVTHAVGDILTASDWNISSNDLSFLGGSTVNEVAASQTTASTSYVDLGTVGPAVTATTGANALVLIAANMSISVANDVAYMACAVTGATTLAAPAGTGYVSTRQASGENRGSFTFITGLNPGSNTFTAKYQVAGAATGTWDSRTLVVIPLP